MSDDSIKKLLNEILINADATALDSPSKFASEAYVVEFVAVAVATVLERLANEELVIVIVFERLVSDEVSDDVCKETAFERLVSEADVVDTVPEIVFRALDSPETILDSA